MSRRDVDEWEPSSWKAFRTLLILVAVFLVVGYFGWAYLSFRYEMDQIEKAGEKAMKIQDKINEAKSAEVDRKLREILGR